MTILDDAGVDLIERSRERVTMLRRHRLLLDLEAAELAAGKALSALDDDAPGAEANLLAAVERLQAVKREIREGAS